MVRLYTTAKTTTLRCLILSTPVSGSHLMYMIPARYTTPIDVDRDQRTDGVFVGRTCRARVDRDPEAYKDIPQSM